MILKISILVLQDPLSYVSHFKTSLRLKKKSLYKLRSLRRHIAKKICSLFFYFESFCECEVKNKRIRKEIKKELEIPKMV